MTSTDTEWSTREKLAIASYVSRSGEQHWSGVGRLLRPLGEPGRPADWFSPKYCAQQYSALVEVVEAPKRKRSADRTDSTDSVQTVVSPEEAIMSRLTKERIEELKKLVRCERTKYRKIQQEMFLVQSGAMDDKLDEILQRIQDEENADKPKPEDKATTPPVLAPSTSKDQGNVEEMANIEQLAETAAQEMREEIERLNISLAKEMVDLPPTIHLSAPRNHTPVEVMEVAEPVAQATDTAAATEAPILAPETNSTDEAITTCEERKQELSEKIEEHNDSGDKVDDAPTMTQEQPKTILSENMETAAPEAEDIQTEAVAEESTDHVLGAHSQQDVEDASVEVDKVEHEPTQIATDDKQVLKDGHEFGLKMAKETSNLTLKISTETEVPKHGGADDDQSDVTPEGGEHPFSYTGMDHEYHHSISLPGTPVRPSSFTCDSFPSSPALSHSSDMDPDATASWKAWRKSIMILWKQVASHRYASLFLQPVTDDIAPNYSTTVYRTMDLAALKKNIENGVIRTTSEFQRDLMLMFQNAIMYNYHEHDVYKMTMEMQSDVMDQVAQFLATQIMVETTQSSTNKSLRRSTIRRAALGEKANETRSKRAAAIEGEAKFTRKKPPPHDP